MAKDWKQENPKQKQDFKEIKNSRKGDSHGA